MTVAQQVDPQRIIGSLVKVLDIHGVQYKVTNCMVNGKHRVHFQIDQFYLWHDVMFETSSMRLLYKEVKGIVRYVCHKVKIDFFEG